MPLATPVQQSRLHWFAVWRAPSGKHAMIRTAWLIVCLFLLATIAYSLTYRFSFGYAMSMSIDQLVESSQMQPEPVYQIQFLLPRSFTPVVQLLFAPAHQVDRLLRPQFWSPPPWKLSDKEIEEYTSDFTATELEEFQQLRNQSRLQLEHQSPPN